LNLEVTGIFSLLLLVAVIWAILNVIQSSAETGMKLIWILVILLLPLIGVIIWFFFGPRG